MAARPTAASARHSSTRRAWRNGYTESFNNRVRAERLNINSFWSPTHARVVITAWKADHHHRRRHSSLGY